MTGRAIAAWSSILIWRQLKVLLILRGGVVVLAPALILWAISNTDAAARYIGPADSGFLVGMIESYPNSRNVIPGQFFFTAEFRHPDDETLARMDGLLRVGGA